MEAFLDHMMFISFAFLAICLILGGWCWLCETLIVKFGNPEKFAEFLRGKCDDDFEEEEEA